MRKILIERAKRTLIKGTNKVQPFSREKFLLRLVAWILMVQFGVWGVLGMSCAFVFLYKSTVAKVYDPTCAKAGVGFQNAVDSGLSVLLALLGGGALATDEIKRRREGQNDDEPPRR